MRRSRSAIRLNVNDHFRSWSHGSICKSHSQSTLTVSDAAIQVFRCIRQLNDITRYRLQDHLRYIRMWYPPKGRALDLAGSLWVLYLAHSFTHYRILLSTIPIWDQFVALSLTTYSKVLWKRARHRSMLLIFVRTLLSRQGSYAMPVSNRGRASLPL